MLEPRMEDATEIAKKKHLARQKRYYERNAEAIRERKRQAYDAAKSSEYYEKNRETIRERQRELYLTHKKSGQRLRLSELISIASPAFQEILRKVGEAVEEGIMTDEEIGGLEKAVLLSRNYVASDSKVDE